VAHLWQLTKANAITPLTDLHFTGNAPTASLPAQSITLFCLPAVRPAPPSYQPDLTICKYGDTSYIGAGVYSLDGTGETKSQTTRQRRAGYLSCPVKNASNTVDSFNITCPPSASGWKVQVVDQATGRISPPHHRRRLEDHVA